MDKGHGQWGLKWFFFRKLLGFSPFFIFFFFTAALFFLVWSEADIWFSALFWNPETDFFLRSHFFARFIFISVEWLCYGLGGFLLIWAFAFWLFPPVRRLGGGRFLLFALLLLVLGPGLVVNFIFKDHWGRARPVQIESFGGKALFTPAFVMAGECQRNCSFASGHASAAAWLLCLALFARIRKYKKQMIAAGWLYFVLVGMGRIVQGGHFLSDVIFALLFVYMVAVFLERAFWPKASSP
ncbi:lipid A 4'-phosphatase [Desulfobotulus alkaliphilus]|uniref:Lipid A 4'-phosphatase n=1 Tax=Desulfobotulus alkaliphilus TaxID=622671 RepID=A0A562RII9_9BACT|nr:phosphatase PAP2 family protein [Desulfobotulus alkaliphilus]TWI68166.1 lipid A 4'-phosphatase [Desulfobotulus alkaliphilus]